MILLYLLPAKIIEEKNIQHIALSYRDREINPIEGFLLTQSERFQGKDLYHNIMPSRLFVIFRKG